MKKYILAPRAAQDLEEILIYIATDRLEASLMVHRRFEEVFRFLGGNPMAGHIRRDLTKRPLRFFPVYSYLVVYKDDIQPVEISRVLSATRNVKRLLD